MAKHREPEKPVESDTESGEEEDDEASSEEAGSQESDSEPEPTQFTKKPSSSTPAAAKKPQPQSASKPQQREPTSDEEESGSESESDSDGPNVRPIATKPMDDPQKSNNGAKKSRSKPTASDLVTPTTSAARKRPAEERETESKDAKKSKKKAEPENLEKKTNDDPKKILFQRLWSEDDEIAILKGMIDFKAKKKYDPSADLNAFHDFIRKNLHVDVTRTQLQDKIRRLRKKYENNRNKEKEGRERMFTKPHEQNAYEWSKYVWGNENGKENGGEKVVGSPKANDSIARKAPSKRANGAYNEDVSNEKSLVVVDADSERMLSAKRVKSICASVEESIMMFGDEMFEEGKGHQGEKEWKKLRMDEMEAYIRHLEVKAAQARLVMDTLKSAGH